MRKLAATAEAGVVVAAVGQAAAHESSEKHVRGTAAYVDDMPVPAGTLFVATGWAPVAAAKGLRLDLDQVRQIEGVIDVCTEADVPGSNDVSPVHEGDVLFASGEVSFHGQVVFAVAATSQHLAEVAVKKAIFTYETQPVQLTAAAARATEDFVLPTRTFQMGSPALAMQNATRQVQGALHIRGQEHFYLEGQVALVSPTEDGGVAVLVSSQHPSEVQKLVASTLGIALNRVTVSVRRMGGAFGGKETQAAPLACIAALFARRTGRAIKYRMPRQQDMMQTGKRHDFENEYRLGFDDQGVIQAAELTLAARCGYSADLSDSIVDRAMFHADNAYCLQNAQITGYRCRTNTVSNTAFRGFGGPQGMLTIEAAMDHMASTLDIDPVDVRLRNLYRPGNDETPYGQKVTDFRLGRMMDQLIEQSHYRQRRQGIAEFNARQSYLRRGLALTPVKFGISFTATHLNQAGALIHIYSDGSVHLNHGGTEMGQGLLTKVQQIVASAFGVSTALVQVSATATDKVPNTSPTAASSGTDLNAMAALDAANQIKARLIAFLAQGDVVGPGEFSDGKVRHGDVIWDWADLIQAAYLNRVSLSATGFYKTPDIHFDRATGKGQPFYYYAFGVACSEVVVDTTTGEYRLSQVDILHDVGRSLNPALDQGQIEGGFVQGLGWLTTEELLWNEAGHLISNSPSNYKIPTAFDIPDHFKVTLFQEDNPEATVFHSKAVGEPPLMLAISVWCALRDACRRPMQPLPDLAVPATPEQVYWALSGRKDAADLGRGP